MISLDTNVLSETMKSEPSAHSPMACGSSAGAALHHDDHASRDPVWPCALSKGKRRTALMAAAERCATGRPIAQFDAQIAAIARSHGAAVATRNTQDFEGCGIKVLNSWPAAPRLK